MRWWDEAQRSAAHEFGRRHYRGIATWLVVRRLIGPTLAGLVLAGVGWALWHWTAWWSHHLMLVLPAATALCVALLAGAAWSRLGTYLEVYLPVPHPAFAVVVLALVSAGATALSLWLA